MAKVVKGKGAKRRSMKDETLPLHKENFMILGVGILVIAAGYGTMVGETVEGFFPLVAAPILLVLGYCVIIPLGLLFKRPMSKTSNKPDSAA
mgnify:CR=1 FL=1